VKLAELPSFGFCRVAPRLAPYFLAVRQESRQRIAPCRASLAAPDFPLSAKAKGLTLQTRLRLEQQVQTAPFSLTSVRRHRRGFCHSVATHSPYYGVTGIPSIEPVMQCGKWGFPGLLFEPQASLQARPFHALQHRVARRAETAGNVSLPTFLSFDKKVGRQPGRDPAKCPRSQQRTNQKNQPTPHH
jgi:hypothetical protein